MIASLQANIGDFVGARHTANSIPDIKRAEFPGPSDGFYDAIKPAMLATIAQHLFDAGDKVGPSECLRQAIAQAWAIETADQNVVAQIVIAQKQIECGDRDGARDLLKEAIPFALAQNEPLRSRSLAMFVECQVRAGDPAGADRDHKRDPRLSRARKTQVAAQTRRPARKSRRPGNCAGPFYSSACASPRRNHRRIFHQPPATSNPRSPSLLAHILNMNMRSIPS